MNNEGFYPRDNETLPEYIERMRVEKKSNGLSWQSIADIANEKYNKSYDESTYRKGLLKQSIVDELIGVLDVVNPISEEDMQLRKLKVQIRDERLQTNANIRRLSREDTIKEIASDYADKMNAKKLLDIPSHKLISHTNKTAILNIGDWHYGLNIDNRWNRYNSDITKQRVSLLTKEVDEYCQFHNVERIIIAGLGDYISGIIHLPLRLNSREDVMTQIMEVSEIIAEMVSALSMNYLIEFYTVLGNHGRIDSNKKDSIQLENLERIIPWYLKDRLRDNPNVFIDTSSDFDMATFTVNGFQFGCAHGDKDGMNQIVKNFTLMTRKPFDVIITAHKHHLGIEEINDCFVVMNPSLMGVDDYAKDLRVSSRPAQTLIMVGERTPVECVYYINLE